MFNGLVKFIALRVAASSEKEVAISRAPLEKREHNLYSLAEIKLNRELIPAIKKGHLPTLPKRLSRDVTDAITALKNPCTATRDFIGGANNLLRDFETIIDTDGLKLKTKREINFPQWLDEVGEVADFIDGSEVRRVGGKKNQRVTAYKIASRFPARSTAGSKVDQVEPDDIDVALCEWLYKGALRRQGSYLKVDVADLQDRVDEAKEAYMAKGYLFVEFLAVGVAGLPGIAERYLQRVEGAETEQKNKEARDRQTKVNWVNRQVADIAKVARGGFGDESENLASLRDAIHQNVADQS